MPPPTRTNESHDANSSTNYQNTSITSPLRRIPSFIDDENEEEELKVAAASYDVIVSKSPVRGTGNNSTKSSPGMSVNKRKRNHPLEIHENELGQLNRLEEEQSQSKTEFIYDYHLLCVGKRAMNQDSPGSPLKKKSAKKPNYTVGTTDFTSSWGSRLKKIGPIINEHRTKSDFEAWSREIWQLGNVWLEISGEEAAGTVYDLVSEFKREHAQFKGFLVIPKICGNVFLDKLQAKSLVHNFRVTEDVNCLDVDG